MLLCAELLRRGHNVTMWTSAYDHIRKEWRREWHDSPKGYRREDGLELRFMKGTGYASNVRPQRLIDHVIAARDFTRQAELAPRPDAIVASLPDHATAAAAVAFARRHGVASVVDVRDKWPDVFVERLSTSRLSPLADLALFTEHRRARQALAGADSVVAVMESLLTWGLAKGRRTRTEHDRVFYLTTSPRNFDPPRVARADPVIADVLTRTEGRTRFVFVGTFNKTQHPGLILDAVDRLRAAGGFDPTRVALIIAGAGTDAETVRTRAAAHENVHYIGWVESQQMDDLLAHADVGILAMNFATEAFNNKAFAYLASGLPIINGATGDLADLLASEHAGLNVPAGNADALARAITRLAEDPALRAELTRNVRRMFLQRFDRTRNYAEYAEHVERIAMTPRPS